MRRTWIKSLALLTVLAVLLSLLPAALSAQPPVPEDKPIQLAKPSYYKPKDIPNPFEYKRLRQREQLLIQGRTAEAAALAKTGSDKLLVILVEFAGTDTATWNPGDIWDPIGDPAAVDFEDYGDCTSVISTTQTFTYSGPLHNQLPQPTSQDHPGYSTIWTEDFGREHYEEMLFGDGIYTEYTMENGEEVVIDLRGYSLRQYYEEQSKGMYTVEGEVIGWVQVPHSETWYGADMCPGARSAGYSPLADGFFPDGGDERSLVRDTIDACVAAYPDLDWAEYDYDGDGLLDHVMIVHAGYGEEDSTALLVESGVGEHALWSHSWTVWPYHDIGDSGLQIGPYTMMAENGTVGLFAHEFAHDLGTIDLYAYGPGETSAGFWSLMADDWGGGWPQSAVPPGLDPWHKYLLGWNDPLVLNTASPETEATVGQACMPPEDTVDSVLINLPPQIEQPVPPFSGEYMWWSGKENWLDAKLTLAAPLDLSEAVSPTLTFNTVYDIEEGWDFGFVQASTDGETWTSLPGTTTTDEHDPDCYFIDEMPGYTGFSGAWLEETVDLADYVGESTVWLRFRYETDPYTLGEGWYLDDVTISDGEEVLFFDDVEADGNWVAEEWVRSDGYIAQPHYYLAEWRNACGFDAGLVSGRYNIQDFGMLLWYRNLKYTSNEPFDHLPEGPAFGPKGACMLLDAHFEPWRSSTSEYVNEAGNLSGRVQMRDAAFGLRDTQPFQIGERWRLGNANEEFGSRPAVSAFHDSLGYYPGLEYVQRGPGDERIQWFSQDWDASVVVPATGHYGIAPPEYPEGEPLRFGGEPYPDGRSAWWWYPTGVGFGGTTGNPGEHCYGVHIEVVEEASDLSWGKLHIWNDTDTFLGWIKVDKEQAGPGDVLTYEVHVKDAASVKSLTTVDIPVPEGTTFIPGSLTGASFVLDQAHEELHDRGRIMWGGRSGGRVLHTPDAYITYQVQVDPDAVGVIHNEALVTIEGHGSYSLQAMTTLSWQPSVMVALEAPSYVEKRAPIRYAISVTNGGAGTLTDITVAASWTGGAYIVYPNPDSWVIESLAPGQTWSKAFTLWTFSTATGEVVTEVEVTHPSIETTTASATTTIVR
jgi:immune inhibitor A